MQPQQGRVTGIVIYLTLKQGGSNAADLCFLPSCLHPKTLLVGINTKSTNLQPKNIFAPLKGIFALTVQKPFQRCKKFNCSVICSATVSESIYFPHPLWEISHLSGRSVGANLETHVVSKKQPFPLQVLHNSIGPNAHFRKLSNLF